MPPTYSLIRNVDGDDAAFIARCKPMMLRATLTACFVSLFALSASANSEQPALKNRAIGG